MKLNIKAQNRLPVAIWTALLLTSVSTVPARADEQVRSQTVKFQDLNLSTPAGVETLYKRIHWAAKNVCSETDPVQRLGAPACARSAEAKAIEKVNLPQLTAYYNGKTKGGRYAQALIASR